MKKSDIYEIVIKVFGLYLFFTTIELLNDVLTTFTVWATANQTKGVFDGVNYLLFFILAIVSFAIKLFFAAFFTFRTKVVAKFICGPKDYRETATLFTERKEVYEMALVIMGLLLIIWTIPDLVFKLRTHIQLVQSNTPTDYYDTAFIVTAAIKVTVGLAATIFAKPVSSILVKGNK